MILTDLLFIGRLHPLLVHLPIGILLLAFLFEFLSYLKGYENLKPAVVPALLIGSVSSLLSAITGYVLSQEGGYDSELVVWHQYFGIGTSVASVLVCLIVSRSTRKAVRFSVLLVLISLLVITGHLGGSLTHREDFLFAGVETAEVSGRVEILPEALLNPTEVNVFKGVVQPILSEKCYGCHSSKKQKGQLRLDTEDGLLKGGKHGAIIDIGNLNESELIKRISLPIEDEHHMPPEARTQLTSLEVDVIKSWVEEGASFEKQLKEFSKPHFVTEFIQNFSKQGSSVDTPLKEIGEVDQEAVSKLTRAGIHVVPIAIGSNYLVVSFAGRNEVSTEEVKALNVIAPNVVTLDLSGCKTITAVLDEIENMKELRSLFLQRSSIVDSDLTKIESLKNLSVINLTSTAVSDNGIVVLARMSSLKQIFLFQTAVTRTGFDELKKALPLSMIDSGNYRLPVLPGDTTNYSRKK